MSVMLVFRLIYAQCTKSGPSHNLCLSCGICHLPPFAENRTQNHSMHLDNLWILLPQTIMWRHMNYSHIIHYKFCWINLNAKASDIGIVDSEKQRSSFDFRLVFRASCIIRASCLLKWINLCHESQPLKLIYYMSMGIHNRSHQWSCLRACLIARLFM